jgi:hypothetical protein
MTVRVARLFNLVPLLVVVGHSLPLSAAQPAAVSPAAIAVDVTVTHTVVNPDGSQAGPSSNPTTFTLERRHTSSGWTTVLTYRATPRGADRATATPLDGARIEYADGARGVKAYDKDGRLITRLSQDTDGAGLPVFDGAARWLDALLADPQQRDERRLALQRTHGVPIGRIRGLDRYHSRNGDTENEVLADPRTYVVMESSVAREGVLQERVQFEYAARADGTLFRHTIRTEQAPAGGGQARSMVTVAFSNLTVGSAR